MLDAAAVDVAVAGQDAVIDALGGKTPWKVTTMETSAAHNIVGAMRRNGVRRLLKISVVGAGESVKNAGFFNEHVLMRTFLRGLLVDKAGMEAEIEGSNLDWTLVRPPMLTDREKTGVSRVLSTKGGEKAHKIEAGRSGGFHGASRNWKVLTVCASGGDGDDHIAKPRARINLSHRDDPIGPVKPVTMRRTVEAHRIRGALAAQLTSSGTSEHQLRSRKDCFMANFPTPLEEVIHHNVIKNNKTGGPALDIGPMQLLWRALGENTGYTFSIFEMAVVPGMGIPLRRHPFAESFSICAGRADPCRSGIGAQPGCH